MLHSITRQDIEFEGSIRHRVVVRFFNGRKDIIIGVFEGLNPVDVYKRARREAGVKGRAPVEWLPRHIEDYNERFH